MAYQSLHQMNLYDVLGDNPWAQDDDFMKDRDYMKKMYPKMDREMVRWVEDVCDEEEYDGSCMYDEYPDVTAMEIWRKGPTQKPEDRNRRIFTGR